MDGSSAISFREALGSFATGVTIVTSVDAIGSPIGVTATSFNSVSIDPPLVLWSLSKTSLSLPAFAKGGHFAVHVLGADQQDLANRFAQSGIEKFAGVDWTKGNHGSPIIPGSASLFECEARHQYDGGDHVILVGEVLNYATSNNAPLVFHGGRYAQIRPLTKGDAKADPEVSTN
jgi:3-hydroxy-9,10-secoandrosta-1,3,5(10)-triene-9,17-dione monooxygenase reductase component